MNRPSTQNPDNLEQYCYKHAQTSIIYTVKRSSRRRKGMAIGVTPHGVTVAAPSRASMTGIHALVEKHAEWIIKKMAQHEQQSHFAPPRRFAEGSTVYYLGKPYALKISPIVGRRTMACLRPHCVEMFLPEAKSAQLKSRMIDWYKQRAAEILPTRLALYQQKVGVKYREVKIANQKTQWGSCDRHGVLRLNWRLILLPLRLLDYVVVHELCHIVHLNHSSAFWSLVEKVQPDYAERRALLNQHGAVFMW